jgi:phosphocarrier protein
MSNTTIHRQAVVVGSRVGLHARPATLVAKRAAELPAVISITKGERVATDARSTLMILALGAEHGDEVTLAAEGEGAEESVTTLAELIATDMDADA